MICFFCGTMFQVFQTVLLKKLYFKNDETVLFIISPLKKEDFELEALGMCGFDKIIILPSTESEEIKRFCFDYVFFFSLFCGAHNYIYSLEYKQLILIYEGITSFQLKHWSKSGAEEWFALESIDQFWLPDLDLLLDDDLLPKCRKYSLNIKCLSNEELVDLCILLNRAFRYCFKPFDNKTVFMDRYLTRYGSTMSKETEEVLTQNIYFRAGNDTLVKIHPYDHDNLYKYRNLPVVNIIKDNVPWELVYLNELLLKKKVGIEKYIIYNSFAPINTALLFGDVSFVCDCIEPILDKYSDIENTFLNSEITIEIFNRFMKKYKVEINYIDNLEQLGSGNYDKRFTTIDEMWDKAEKAVSKYDYYSVGEVRAFRLQLDTALLSLKKSNGKYYCSADNYSSKITRELLDIALPSYEETFEERDCDLIIDCDNSYINNEKDWIDIRNMHVIEGCYWWNDSERCVSQIINNIENIYIWGITWTNEETFRVLKKLGKTNRIRKVFDSFACGINHDIKIEKYSKEKVESNSFIFVCAASAYREIKKILENDGFVEGINFSLGLGINCVR